MEITIKPHHFMDIIKLYGSGITDFVPDEKMKHDFYKIANRIIGNHDLILKLTTGADDICAPCIMCKDRKCTDELKTIEKFNSKEAYNTLLDTRLLEKLNLDISQTYKAKSLCAIMYDHHDCIYSVWQEEHADITQKRHDLFVEGAKNICPSYKRLFRREIRIDANIA